MPRSKALKKAQQKYDEANTIRIGLKLNHKTDADIIQWLKDKPSKQGAIKSACRTIINKESK